MNNMNMEMKQQDQIDWRRSKVIELNCQGYTERDIAQKLQVGQSTVHRDLVAIRKQAQEELQYHIHQRLPEEYQSCMKGMKLNLRQTLEIADTAADPRVKLQARAIANDCYKYIMDLTTNGAIVTDAIKMVTQKQEQIDTLRKLDERIESFNTEEETTTNGVFYKGRDTKLSFIYMNDLLV